MHCSHSGQVCGHNGETYETECEANAHKVPVDYFAACSSGHFDSNARLTSQLTSRNERPCPGICAYQIDNCPKEDVIKLPGSCCPMCASALRISYSKQLAERNLQTVRAISAVSVMTLATQFEDLLSSSHCKPFTFVNRDGDIVLVLMPRKQQNLFQLRVCSAELDRMKSLIAFSSPQVTARAPMSLLVNACRIESAKLISSSAVSLQFAKLLVFSTLALVAVRV